MIYHVNGSVTATNSQYFNCLTFGDLIVRVFQVDFGSQTDIGNTTVATDGTFTTDITTDATTIVVKLFHVIDTVETLVDTSGKFCHHDTVDVAFSIDESKFTQAVYLEVVARLDDKGADTSSDVFAYYTDDDIEVLGCLTCVTVRTLKRFQAACRLNLEFNDFTTTLYSETEDAIAAFQASEDARQLLFLLVQDQYDITLADVFTHSGSELANLMTDGVTKNELEERLNSSDVRTTIIKCRDGLLLNAIADSSYYDAKLIHLSDNEYTDKHSLLNDALNGGGLAGIISTVDSENSDELKRVIPLIKLDQYLLHYPPMLEIAIDNVGIGSDPDYYDLALLDVDFWEGIIVGWPGSADSAEDYAERIEKGLAANKPSARVSKNLGASGITDASTMAGVLDDNPDFDISQHSVSSYFSKVDTDPNYLEPVTAAKLQALQRSVKLTGDTSDMVATKTLQDNSLSSSYAMTRAGRSAVTGLLTAAGVPAGKADDVYCKAEAMNSTVSMLMTQYMRYDSSSASLPSSLSNPIYPPVDPLPNLPDMESIFGNLDTCNCSDCQSVYSPAAYLTDLLHWLTSSVVCDAAHGGGTGFDALMRTHLVSGYVNRRMDIRYLSLNCKNTNTLVPYIDIVNEILSVNMLVDTGTYSPTDIIDAYKTLQTTKTAEEILVQPEHRFPDAEALLKTSYYPWVLPYDAAYDEATVYLQELKMPYPNLLNAFSSPDIQYDNAGWGHATLGLSASEVTLIKTPQSADPAFWKKFWGIETAELTDDAVSPATPGVGPVMKHAGLTLNELQAIIGVYYLSDGTTPITIVPFEDDACDIDHYTFLPKFTIDVADRFMRFVRLMRKTGLSAAELDLAFFNYNQNYGPGLDLDETLFTNIASRLTLAKQYNLTYMDLEMVGSQNGYTNLYDTTTPVLSPYYNDKFLNPLLSADTLAFFTLPYSADLDTMTNADRQQLAKIFNVTIPHIQQIATLVPSGPMDQYGLSIFQSYSTIVKMFGIEADQLLNTLVLIGNPGGSITPKALWTFADKYAQFQKLGVKVNDFEAIVGGTGIYDFGAPEMLANAEAAWNALEAAYKTERLAHPEKLFDTSSPYLPLESGDQTYFENVIVDNFRLSFGLNFQDTKDIIESVSTTWLSDYIADPDGLGALRTWANRGIYFVPYFAQFTRIALVADFCGMDASGITAAVDNKIRATLTLPDDHFYWLAPAFVSFTAENFTWIKNVTDQAKLLGISQGDYLAVVSDYLANYATTYTAADSSGIVALYNAMSAASVYKTLSIFEFTQTFLKSQIVNASLPGVTDLPVIMNGFDGIFKTVKILDFNVTDTWNWVTSFTDVSPFSADIRRVLNARYPVFDDWSDEIVPVQNGLRGRLRDALVGYYIGNKAYKDANAIYGNYLLDTQMAPCNQTSRVVSAISSVQLLVFRALLGLEATVCMDDDDKKEWEWRKNYRVWEANRQVFLYPENWIDPSLRTNKTSIFKDAEDLLQQDEINQQNSEAAYAGYLTGLNDIAHLDVRATFIEMPNLAIPIYIKYPTEIMHVFARTWNPPYIHYHRTYINNVWSAWEKMELETDSDHLIPVIFNRKLYVFFPLFVEKQHRTVKDKLNGEDVNAPYLEIKMCYTKLDFGKWSHKKVLDGTLQCGKFAGINIPNTDVGLLGKLGRKLSDSTNPNSLPIPFAHEGYNSNLLFSNEVYADYTYTSLQKESFYFHPQINNTTGDLTINVKRDYGQEMYGWHNNYTGFAVEWGFHIGACDEKVTIVPPSDAGRDLFARPYMTVAHYQQMKRGKDWGAFDPSNPGNDAGLWMKTAVDQSPSSTRILKTTNSDFVLTYPQQFSNNLTGQPFFYADKLHSMFFYGGKFNLHEHPFTCKMLEALNRFGIDGLLNPASNNTALTGLGRQSASVAFFAAQYSPTPSVPTPYPIQEYDFSGSGPYALYNWEVFFHSVSLIARQLRQSNKYEEAFKWLSYIFDPSNRDVSLLDLRYWKIKPFLIDATKGVSYFLRLLSAPNLTPAELLEKQQWEAQIDAWRDNPFDPHLIASMRPRAYMLWTVMEMISTLTDWGDYLFRQDTTESINEAVNLYTLASILLGDRPQQVDRPSPPDFSYDDIMGGLSAFSDAAVGFENLMTAHRICDCDDVVPDVKGIPPYTSPPCDTNPGLTVLPDLIFCIPDNPTLTALWDRVDDRLFKIRNCMDIDGKIQQVALFSPPIDPGLLVRATAMGLDLSDVLSDLNAAAPHYRFSYLLQRANDFCNEVKSLGSQLLTALEKKDSEELSLLRQVHEQNILKASRAIKEMQLQEAQENYTTMEHSKTLIQIRLDDYKNRAYQNTREQSAQQQTAVAEGLMNASQGVKLLAGGLIMIPDAHTGTVSFAKLPGGDKISYLINQGANALDIVSSISRNKASMSLTFASYDRRQEEWNLQIKSAIEELLQVDRQLLSAQIRIAVAEKELENHDLQVDQSAEIYDWLKDKYTNQELYTWMAGQLKILHRKSYDLAYDLAKQAQQAFFKELGDDADIPKIAFGDWDSSRAGFFAGERLSVQLKDLEKSYMQNNTRRYELTKNISLALLDPFALETLKSSGTCDITLPEVLFDMDYPNHYYRKIRSVSITIPGIAGPYTTVNATLTLLSHETRVFTTNPHTTTNTVEQGLGEGIAASSGQNDSGVFELNFKDERYMPFENKGAVSKWRLEFPDLVRQFDFTTIADVIIHMQYTAKEAGAVFAGIVKTYFAASLNAMDLPYKDGFNYAIDLRHDMPNEWHMLKMNGTVNITIDKNKLPYYAQALNPVIDNTTSLAMTLTALARSASGLGSDFTVDTIANTFAQYLTTTDYYKVDFATGTLSLSLNTPITIATSLGTGEDFSELILIVKIGVS